MGKVPVQETQACTGPWFLTLGQIRNVKSRLTGNAAAGNAYNVADRASLQQAVRNAGANNVVSSAPGVLE